MDVFTSRDYRAIIRGRISAMPKEGYGQLSRLATRLGVNATFVSQVLNRLKNLNEDQGYTAAEFFEFNEMETVYFLLLIQRERAGGHKLKALLDRQIAVKQKDAQRVKGRISVERELSAEEQAIFYSDWLYTAVHTLASIPGVDTPDLISTRLNVPRTRVTEVGHWLLQHGLLREEKGRLTMGSRNTYIDASSSLAERHHSNWRLKALEHMPRRSEDDFFFTAPFSISKKDFQHFRQELVRLVDALAKRVEATDPQESAVIGIDLFKF